MIAVFVGGGGNVAEILPALSLQRCESRMMLAFDDAADNCIVAARSKSPSIRRALATLCSESATSL